MKKKTLSYTLPAHPECRTLPIGEYHRISGSTHTSNYKANEFRSYKDFTINSRGTVVGPNKKSIANTRFSPIVDKKGKFISTLYIGETARCAYAETLLRIKSSTALTLRACEGRSRFALSLNKPLTLLNLAPPVINSDSHNDYSVDGINLLESDNTWYKATCEFARQTYQNYPDIAGLYWGSRQIINHASMVLFETRLNGAKLSVVDEFEMLSIEEMGNWLMDAALVGIAPDPALLKKIQSEPLLASTERFF